MRVTYEEAISRNYIVSLEGDIPKGKNRMINFIRDGVPMKMKKVSKILLDEMDSIEYIDLWSRVKIHKEIE